MKTAIVSGVTGQVASYLTELLLEQDYKIYGIIRRSSSFNTGRIDHLYQDPHISKSLELVYGDLSDYSSIASLVSDVKPDYFYNLAAQSHVRCSFDICEYTMDVTGTGVLRCLEAVRKHSPQTRFLQASSSEQFGSSPPPQNEQTLMHPRSPYACAKLAAYSSVINYREAYNMFAANAISFNSESPRRGETFVTKKITRAATKIKLGLQDKLYLGNLNSKRDWLHSFDTARAMIAIINAEKPDEYCVSSGIMHSVQEFCEIVFSKLNLDWRDYVEIDPKYFRPAEVDALCGDSTKLRTKLGWLPEYTFEQLIDEMVEHDLKLAQQEKMIKEAK